MIYWQIFFKQNKTKTKTYMVKNKHGLGIFLGQYKLTLFRPNKHKCDCIISNFRLEVES